MYNTTADYKTYIKKPSRSFECRLKIGSRTLNNSDIIQIVPNVVQPKTGFSIGNTVSQSIDITLKNDGGAYASVGIAEVEIGLKIGNSIEYIPMGTFNIDDVTKTDYTVKFTAYDNMIKFETGYFSSLGDTPTLQQVVDELASITGVEFTGTVPNYTVTKLQGYTCREVLGYVASVCGGNAYITRDGKFTIVYPTEVDCTITADNYINTGYKLEDTEYKVGMITCQNKSSDTSSSDTEDYDSTNSKTTISVGTLASDSMELTFENPWVTETILNDIYNKLKDFSYLGYTLKWQGDLSLDPGDIITVTDVKNVNRKAYVYANKLTYTGGLVAETSAKGETKNSNSFNSSGSTTQDINRISVKLLIAEKAIITKANIKDLEATNAKIENLDADIATINTALIHVATIDDLAVTNETVTNLAATSATITQLNATNANVAILTTTTANINNALISKVNVADLTATNANISTLNSDVANIKTLVNGNLTSANIQSLLLTSSKVTVDNGFIKNAMIENLDVSKINAGTLNTNKISVSSSDGGLIIAGATQQFKDNNKNVRLQLGQDATGNFNFILRDADGTTTLIDGTGVHEKAIADKLIKTNMVADQAITSEQINYSSFVTGLNADTNTSYIKASKVAIDLTGQTLDIAFNNMNTTVTNVQSTATTATTTANSASSTASTALNTANSASNTASTALSTANTAKSSVDNLQVGSRNLLLNTKDFSQNWSSYGTITKTANAYKGLTSYFTPSQWGRLQQTYAFEKGKIYTMSAYMKADNANVIVQCYSDSVTSGNVTSNVALDWTRYSYTFTASSTLTSRIDFESSNMNTIGGNLYVCGYKLEIGNQATDWTPAPEDVDSAITSVKTVTETNTTSISAIQGQISTLISNTTVTQTNGTTTQLKDAYNSTVNTINSMQTTIGQHTTNIDANTGNITSINSNITSIQASLSSISASLSSTQSTVSSHTTQISTATTTANTALTNINSLQVGGRNLILNSDNGYLDTLSIYNFSNATYSKTSDSWRRMTLTSQLASNEVVQGSFVSISKIGYYTFSIYARTDGTISNASVSFFTNENGHNVITATIKSCGNNIYRIYATANLTNLYNIRIVDLKNVTTTGATYIDFRYPKFEYGNQLTDYTVAPEDTDNTISTVNATATTANTNANTAISTSNTASTNANNAVSTSNTANSTATTANTNASTALTNSTTAVNTANTASSTANSAVTTANSASSTANTANTAVTNLTTTVNTTITRVSSLELTTSGLTTRVGNTETAISSLSIGGRNLLIRSNETKGYGFNWNTTGTLQTMSGHSVSDFIPVKASTQYCISIWTTLSSLSDVYWYDSNQQYVSRWGHGYPTGEQHTVIASPSNALYARIDFLTAVEEIKFEIGNQYTDWTPAPEDTENSIANVKDYTTTTVNSAVSTINQTTDGIKASVQSLQSSVTTIQTTLGTKADTTTVTNISNTVASLQTSVNSINASITSLNSSVTTVTTTANAALTNINNLSIGGRNLALGTATAKTITGTGTTNQCFNIYNVDYSKVVGKQVAISFDIVSSVNSGTMILQWNATPWATLGIAYTNVSTTVKHMTATATQPSSGSPTALQIRLDNVTGTVTISNLKLELGNQCTDWTPAPEDIDSSISTVNATATTANTTANSANSTANTASTNASSAISTANSASSTANGANSTANTALTNSNNAVTTANNASANANNAVTTANKASSDVATLTTTVTNTVNRVSSLELTTSGLTTTVSNVQTTINSLTIGGRNLIKNSNFYNGSTSWSLSGYAIVDTTFKFNTHNTLKISKSDLTSDNWSGAQQVLSCNCSQGTIYTASCCYYVADTSLLDYGFAFEIKGKTSSGDVSICSYPTLISTTAISQKWTKISYTFTINRSDITTIFAYPWVRRNGTVWFSDFKLEIGNQCTDWTPAPEDIDSAISNVQTYATTTINSNVATINQTTDSIKANVSSLQSNVNTINTTLGNKADSSTVTSLSNTVASLQTSLTGINASITTINSNVSSVTTTANTALNNINNLQVGGRNLLLNTAPNGTNSWGGNYSATSTLQAIDESSALSGKAMQITINTITNTNGGVFKNAPTIVTGQTYTWSVYLKASRNLTLTTIGHEQAGRRSCDITTSWQKFSYTFVADSNTYHQFVFYNGFQSGDILYIHSLKLEEGNKATSWTPAPEDVDGSISSANTNANTALTNSNTAISTANSANSTASTASTNASSAVNTANTASSTASNAISTANTANSTANTALSTANSANTNANSALSTVNNLQVGGRNRALATATPITKTGFTGATNYCTSSYTVLTSGLIVGKSVTVSFDFTYSGLTYSGSKNVYVQGNGDVTGWTTPWTSYGFASSIDWTNGSGTLKVQYTFTISSTQMTNNKFYVGLRTDYITGGTMTISNFKVEQGNTKTDWTPAPEDVDTQITTVNTSVTSLQSSVSVLQSQIALKVEQSNIDTAVTTINGKIATTNSNVSNLQSSINLQLSSITSQVNKTVSTKNLINNPAFNNTLGDYGVVNTISACDIVPYTTYTSWGYAKAPVCENALRVKYEMTGDNYVMFKNLFAKVKPSTTYTLSYYYTINGEYTGASSYIYERTIDQWNQSVYSNPTGIGPDAVTSRSTWVRYTKTFTTQSTTDSIMLRFGFHQTHSSGICEMLITGLQIEEGSSATDWVNSANSIVGTSITQSTTDVMTAFNNISSYFQVSADGAKFGNIDSGDYTLMSSAGMQHHIGGTNYDYMYLTYEQTVSMTIADNSSYLETSFSFDSTLLTLLNGRIPKKVIVTDLSGGAYYTPDGYILMSQDLRAWCIGITSSGFTMHGIVKNRMVKYSYSSTPITLSPSTVYGGDLLLKVLILA